MLKNIFSSSTLALVLFSISSAETPDGYYAPASIGGGTLNAQDSNWPVYDETISFSSSGTFTANITNGIDDPSGSGSYTYSKTGTNTASLSYTIDGPGYSFEYDLQFTGENKGIYTKFANYGGGTTDETTGPFTLSGVPVPEQFPWEDYDDFSSGSLDSSKWDVWWGAGGALAVVENGALKLSGSGNVNDPASTVVPEDLTYIPDENLSSKHSIALINQDDIYGVEAEFMIPTNPSDDTGLNFIFFDWAADGSKQEFGPELEYRSESGLRTEFAWTEPGSGESMQITRPASYGTYYKMSLIHTESTNSMYLNGELIKEFSSSGFEPDTIGFAAFNDDGLSYDTYVKNVRVLRHSQETTEPDPVTVVSDPNGQAVVVQVGENYQWNSTLDGITLWGVEQSSDGWSSMTMRFENGRNFGNEGFYDSVAQPQPYDVTFEIDENGYIKSLEDDGDYQYYNAVSVENGVIGTIQNDEGVDSVANNGVNAVDQWFFTTRAAAEEYYYSKVNPKDWMWFDHYPWVYSNEQQDWLYFHPSGGTLMYFSNKGQAWRQFN
jgi:hypothetical protein